MINTKILMGLMSATPLLISIHVQSQTLALGPDKETDGLMAQADFSFVGSVVDIQYKSARDGVAHTFVTYAVEDTLSGTSESSEVTLRFMGGLGTDEGDVYRDVVHGNPQFDVGDRDIIFAKGNGRAICPLVDCSRGKIEIDSDGKIGRRQKLHDELTRRGIGTAEPESEDNYGPQIKHVRKDAKALLDTLKASTKSVNGVNKFESVSIHEEFDSPLMKASRSSATVTGSTRAKGDFQ